MCVTIGSLAIPLGCIIGFGLPTLLLKSYPNPTQENLHEQIREEIRGYIFWQSIIVTVMVVPILVLIRNKPRNAPSKTAYYDKPTNTA